MCWTKLFYFNFFCVLNTITLEWLLFLSTQILQCWMPHGQKNQRADTAWPYATLTSSRTKTRTARTSWTFAPGTGPSWSGRAAIHSLCPWRCATASNATPPPHSTPASWPTRGARATLRCGRSSTGSKLWILSERSRSFGFSGLKGWLSLAPAVSRYSCLNSLHSRRIMDFFFVEYG